MTERISIFETEDAEALMEAVDVLKILSNPHRLAILCHLGEEELSVNEMVELIGIGQSALSQHLSKLKLMGLVDSRREHNKIFYSLSSKEVEAIIDLLKELYCRNIKNQCA